MVANQNLLHDDMLIVNSIKSVHFFSPIFPQFPFFLGTLISVSFINGCSAIMQSGVFGLAGLLPQRFMQGVMHGQATGMYERETHTHITVTTKNLERRLLFCICLINFDHKDLLQCIYENYGKN